MAEEEEQVQATSLERWADFFSDNPLRDVLTAAAGVSIGLLAINEAGDPPDWLAIHPLLTIQAFLLAFLKVWNARAQGAIVASSWDALNSEMTRGERRSEVLLEFPWVFVMFVLMYSAVSYQAFLALLALLYLIYLIYAWLLRRVIRRAERVGGLDRAEAVLAEDVRWFYRRRAVIDSIGIVATVVGLVAFTSTIDAGDQGSWAVSGSFTAAIFVVEYVGFSLLRAEFAERERARHSPGPGPQVADGH